MSMGVWEYGRTGITLLLCAHTPADSLTQNGMYYSSSWEEAAQKWRSDSAPLSSRGERAFEQDSVCPIQAGAP